MSLGDGGVPRGRSGDLDEGDVFNSPHFTSSSSSLAAMGAAMAHLDASGCRHQGTQHFAAEDLRLVECVWSLGWPSASRKAKDGLVPLEHAKDGALPLERLVDLLGMALSLSDGGGTAQCLSSLSLSTWMLREMAILLFDSIGTALLLSENMH
jgi:hypothetical protein